MLRWLTFATAIALLVPLASARAGDTPPAPPAPAPAPVPGAPPAPAPGLVPEPVELDFGIVAQNQVLDAQFTLKNMGSKKIHIHKPIADCGCYQATLEANDVEPGGAVVVKVKFDTGTWSG